MTFLENVFIWCCQNIPWLIIAAAAALALTRRKKSYPLMLQILGAAGLFFVVLLWELVFAILRWMDVSWQLLNLAGNIFAFLRWGALIIFVAGFCWEKLNQWREATPAPAVPAK